MCASEAVPRPGVLLVALCAVVPALPRLVTSDFCLDDAYIHLSYVKSLHLGEGLSYNPHDLETGMSSPLWVFVLALIPAWMLRRAGRT